MSRTVTDQFFARVSAVSIASLLEAASRATTEIGPVRLVLHGGVSFRGWICQTKREGHEWLILLRGIDSGGAKVHELTWIHGSAVVAVTVEYPETVAEHFGFGRVDLTDLESPKSGLELRRICESAKASLESVLGVKCEIDAALWQKPDFAASASALFVALESVANKLMADAEAVAAVRVKISSLRVVVSRPR